MIEKILLDKVRLKAGDQQDGLVRHCLPQQQEGFPRQDYPPRQTGTHPGSPGEKRCGDCVREGRGRWGFGGLWGGRGGMVVGKLRPSSSSSAFT